MNYNLHQNVKLIFKVSDSNVFAVIYDILFADFSSCCEQCLNNTTYVPSSEDFCQNTTREKGI